MIPCPSCGVPNRRGSKYCHRCGQRLDVAFDISCPACDRLNPAGSAFCAFCGAAVASPAAIEKPATAREPAAEQSVEKPHLPLNSEPQGVEPGAGPQRELPSWLYEQAAGRPEAPATTPAGQSMSAAEPGPAQSKYLNDIPGALPKTDGWLSSANKADRPAESREAQAKPKGQAGCLTLVLATLLAVAGIVVIAG